jgi:hypothetical protein
MSKSVLAVITGTLALALIALASYVTLAPRSCGADHCLKVWVQTDGGKPTIHVSAPELHIQHGQEQVIFWNISNTGSQAYIFPDKGIAFMDGDGGTEAFECSRQNDTKFKCQDKRATEGKKYKYTVTVVGTPQPGALPVNPLDPWIFSD